MGKQTDALQLAMNRAAEAAVPEARTLFVDAIQQMSVKYALTIVRGPEDAATQYFKGAMSDKLTERFMPIVSKATANVNLAKQYNDVAGRASALGLIDQKDASLDGYANAEGTGWTVTRTISAGGSRHPQESTGTGQHLAAQGIRRAALASMPALAEQLAGVRRRGDQSFPSLLRLTYGQRFWRSR